MQFFFSFEQAIARVCTYYRTRENPAGRTLPYITSDLRQKWLPFFRSRKWLPNLSESESKVEKWLPFDSDSERVGSRISQFDSDSHGSRSHFYNSTPTPMGVWSQKWKMTPTPRLRLRLHDSDSQSAELWLWVFVVLMFDLIIIPNME